AAWKLSKAPAADADAGEAGRGGEAAGSAPMAELSWDEIRPVEPPALEVGYRLIALVAQSQGGQLLARIKGVRRKLTQDLGFLIPAVNVRDNLELAPGQYRLLVHGVPVASGELVPDRELALDPGRVLGPLDGIPGKDPAFGLDAVWIAPGQRAHAESLGYTVVDAATVAATHLSHVVRERASELLGHDEVQNLLSALGRSVPKLVED